MKKPFNILSKAAMVSVFTASAIIPVATVSEAKEDQAAYEVDELVFLVGDKLAKVDLLEYLDEYTYGFTDKIQHVVYPNGEVYSLEDYLEEFIYSESLKELYETLSEKGSIEDKIYQGYFEDGVLKIKDDQPEDRLNETFFYNFAA